MEKRKITSDRNLVCDMEIFISPNQIDFSDQIHKPSIFWWSVLTKIFLYT